MPWSRPEGRLARYCRRGFVLALAAVPVLFLLTGSLLPMPPVNDKLAHAFAYMVLAACALLGFGRRRGGWICAALVLLGLAVEVAQQLYVPAHGASWGDVAANAGGVAVGAGLAGFVGWQVSPKRRAGREARRSAPRSRPR